MRNDDTSTLFEGPFKALQSIGVTEPLVGDNLDRDLQQILTAGETRVAFKMYEDNSLTPLTDWQFFRTMLSECAILGPCLRLDCPASQGT